MSKVRWQLPELDALRGIAVLNVILVHARYWGPDKVLKTSWPYLQQLIDAGQRGVQLFFIVSAFTLYLSHDERKLEHRPTLNFFLRRLFRITPMFYVATLICWAVWPRWLTPLPYTLLSLTYLNNFYAPAIEHGAVGSWSISTEMVFYAVLPFCFRFVRTPMQAAALLALGTAFRTVYTNYLVFFYPDQSYWLFHSFVANISVFAYGILLYLLWRDHIAARPGASNKRWSLAAIFLSIALFLESPPTDPQYLLSGSLIGALLALGLLLHPWKLFVNRATVFLGKISYSLYLLHFYVAHLLETHLVAGKLLPREPSMQIAGVFFATLLLSTPLAYLCWHFIEQPGVQLGRKLISLLEQRHEQANFAEKQF